jgi:squalene-hopene/tetraprenyl-beta-curcumene cyclase
VLRGKTHPPVTPYQKRMLLWAASRVDGLLSETARKKAVAELLALQRPDGGWTLARLVADEKTARFKGVRFADKEPSDGYGTGFVVFVARQAGIAAAGRRLQRGIAWLKANQRASGRWFTPSLNTYTKQHLPSNSGTAFAVLALRACGEIR